eukprot:2898967-Rhodomonas_salina.3
MPPISTSIATQVSVRGGISTGCRDSLVGKRFVHARFWKEWPRSALQQQGTYRQHVRPAQQHATEPEARRSIVHSVYSSLPRTHSRSLPPTCHPVALSAEVMHGGL